MKSLPCRDVQRKLHNYYSHWITTCMTNRLAFFTLTVIYICGGNFERRRRHRLCDEHTCSSAAPRTYLTKNCAYGFTRIYKTEYVWLLPQCVVDGRKNRSVCIIHNTYFPRLKHNNIYPGQLLSRLWLFAVSTYLYCLAIVPRTTYEFSRFGRISMGMQ